MQNYFETVTKHYVADYLSPANRDIFVTENGSFTQRYVYDADGKRLSVELGYADGTARGTTFSTERFFVPFVLLPGIFRRGRGAHFSL